MKTDRRIRDQSGLALVLTLLMISFLVAITVQLMITIDRQVAVAAVQREQVRLDAMALAGMQIARAALAADREENEFDSLHDGWADLRRETLRPLTGDVDLDVTVSDLSGRLQINGLGDSANEKYRAIWKRFLLSGRFAVADEDEADALLDALADWLDQDDEERAQGAEEDYYRSRATPHSCRNGTVASIEELLLIKGMVPAVVYGDNEHEGIAPYVTVVGKDGKINLNTAPIPVLAALSPEMTAMLAQELVEYREDRKHREELATTDWYRRVSGFPASIDLGSDQLTVTSNIFAVKVTAQAHGYSRTGTGLLFRSENRQQLLSWRTE